MFKNLTIRTKLLATFVLVSLIPLAFVTFIAIQKAGEALREETIGMFTAIQETKRNHVKDYYSQIYASVNIVKDDPYLLSAMEIITGAFEDAGKTVDDEAWRTLVKFKEASIINTVEKNGFFDLLMISQAGDIVYSTAKGTDLGMNITEGALASSTLSQSVSALSSAADEMFFADFAPYAPSNGEQAAFMMAVVKNRMGKVIGSIAIRIPVTKFNEIVQQRSGMGESTESYLIGRSSGKTSLRTDRVVKNDKVGKEVTGKFVDLALEGKSGHAVQIDSTGEKEFIKYDPVDIPGLEWGILTTGSTEEIFSEIDSIRNTMLIIILLVVVIVIGIALATTAILMKPIKSTVAMLKDIAEGEGDLTKRLEVKSRDEFGELSTWFNTFMDKLHSMVSQIASDASTLTGASSDLSDISSQMSDGVNDMSQRTEQVSVATEEMSSTMNNVAAASEQASTNVNMVASAAEEMTVTVREVAQNSENAREITESAVIKAGEASTKIHELGNIANKISTVTEVITEISEQTNLLALNATIEAARAGEAGKGFAVVANEIKELARQTADATQEIKTQIDGVQSSTKDTVKQIEEISHVINEVNEIVATIATAVDEQATTSEEIAGNVAQASQGIQEVNESVNQSSTVASTISDDIVGVNTSVQEISGSSNQVNSKSDELAALADTLRELVGRFKV